MRLLGCVARDEHKNYQTIDYCGGGVGISLACCFAGGQ